MASEKPQFKIGVNDDVQRALEDQRKPLGFHTNNQLAGVFVTACSEVPPEKVWEALAMLRRYKQSPKYPRKSVS